jgi:hypothetical protein
MNCIQHDDQGTSQDQPTEFYAQVILTVTDQAPLLGAPRLARQTMAVLASCGASAPGELWAYVVLPDSVRLIVGRANEESLETFVALVKRRTHTRLMELILRSEDNTVDAVLRYNPMWGELSSMASRESSRYLLDRIQVEPRALRAPAGSRGRRVSNPRRRVAVQLGCRQR